MSFEDRNSEWMGGRREFHQVHSRSGTRLWAVWVENDSIRYEWGQLDGKMQLANEKCLGVNLGKSNEMDAETYALDRAREMCRKKNWEGYREVFHSGTTHGYYDPPAVNTIDFDHLPENMCFYKPDNSMGAGITKKAEAGNVWYARKANGMMFIIAKGNEPAKLYSRRMLRYQDDERDQDGKTWDVRFAAIQKAADSIMPPNSIMLGELVVTNSSGEEDFKAIQSLTKSLTNQALYDVDHLAEIYNQYPAFYCWDIAFWDGQDLVSKVPVRERYELIHEVTDCGRTIIPVQYWNTPGVHNTPEAMIQIAKSMGYEGFVVVDPEGIYGDKAYNFKGKPDRPGSVCAKLKPAYESDFVIYWDPDKGYGERSTKGRYSQGIKCVAMFQYDSHGRAIYISNVSSGMTEEMKRDLADPKFYPRVWKIEYTERTYISQGDDTNALTFARFIEERTDKNPEECINSEL